MAHDLPIGLKALISVFASPIKAAFLLQFCLLSSIRSEINLSLIDLSNSIITSGFYESKGRGYPKNYGLRQDTSSGRLDLPRGLGLMCWPDLLCPSLADSADSDFAYCSVI